MKWIFIILLVLLVGCDISSNDWTSHKGDKVKACQEKCLEYGLTATRATEGNLCHCEKLVYLDEE